MTQVVDCAVRALTLGKPLAYMACLHCSSVHLDAQQEAVMRVCANCGKSWDDARQIIGNPLAVFQV